MPQRRPHQQACGDSSAVEVTFQASPGSPATTWFRLDSYSGLSRVAYGDDGGAPTLLIVPTAGNTVTPAGLDIGSGPNATRGSEVPVFDLAGGSPLLGTGTIAILGSAPAIFSINATSSAGFSIGFSPEGFNLDSAVDRLHPLDRPHGP